METCKRGIGLRAVDQKVLDINWAKSVFPNVGIYNLFTFILTLNRAILLLSLIIQHEHREVPVSSPHFRLSKRSYFVTFMTVIVDRTCSI